MSDKPSWKRAPEWAKYLAQDGSSGTWYWYEERPVRADGSRVWTRKSLGSRQCLAVAPDDADDWQDSLERRP